MSNMPLPTAFNFGLFLWCKVTRWWKCQGLVRCNNMFHVLAASSEWVVACIQSQSIVNNRLGVGSHSALKAISYSLKRSTKVPLSASSICNLTFPISRLYFELIRYIRFQMSCLSSAKAGSMAITQSMLTKTSCKGKSERPDEINQTQMPQSAQGKTWNGRDLSILWCFGRNWFMELTWLFGSIELFLVILSHDGASHLLRL